MLLSFRFQTSLAWKNCVRDVKKCKNCTSFIKIVHQKSSCPGTHQVVPRGGCQKQHWTNLERHKRATTKSEFSRPTGRRLYFPSPPSSRHHHHQHAHSDGEDYYLRNNIFKLCSSKVCFLRISGSANNSHVCTRKQKSLARLKIIRHAGKCLARTRRGKKNGSIFAVPGLASS